VSSTSPPASTRWMLMASAWTIAEVAAVPIRWDVRLALEGGGGTTRMGGREAGGRWAGGGQDTIRVGGRREAGGGWEGLDFDEVEKSLGEELMMVGVPSSGASRSGRVRSVTPSLDGQSGCRARSRQHVTPMPRHALCRGALSQCVKCALCRCPWWRRLELKLAPIHGRSLLQRCLMRSLAVCRALRVARLPHMRLPSRLRPALRRARAWPCLPPKAPTPRVSHSRLHQPRWLAQHLRYLRWVQARPSWLTEWEVVVREKEARLLSCCRLAWWLALHSLGTNLTVSSQTAAEKKILVRSLRTENLKVRRSFDELLVLWRAML
jgi:hypothetical protein